MAGKFKNNNSTDSQYEPRFDFGTNLDPDGAQFATVGELLKEINREYRPEGGEAASFKSLKREIAFIENVAGEKVPDSATPVSLSTLKTIKLLFLTNWEVNQAARSSDGKMKSIHLFDLIAPVSKESATMEFCTFTTIPRDRQRASIIQSMIDELELEIPREQLALFNELARPRKLATFSERLQGYIELANNSIYDLFSARCPTDYRGQANMHYALSRYIDGLVCRKTDTHVPPPVHEFVYCHLQTLGLQHFIVAHRENFNTFRVRSPIRNIDIKARSFCRTLSQFLGTSIEPTDQFTSANEFLSIVKKYPREFNALVAAATGFETEERRFKKNINLARPFLISYGCRCFDEENKNALLISVLDIVAALCSVRYQQEAALKTEYDPRTPGQQSQGTSPERHLTKGLRPDDPHQHQGVFQTYFYRFLEYRAAFTNTTERHHSWMAYQMSRLNAYARILARNGIVDIVMIALALDEMCIEKAERIADSYPGISL
jgi:hypothetical protein